MNDTHRRIRDWLVTNDDHIAKAQHHALLAEQTERFDELQATREGLKEMISMLDKLQPTTNLAAYFPKVRTVSTHLSPDEGKVLLEEYKSLPYIERVSLTNLIMFAHAAAVSSGWWHEQHPAGQVTKKLNFGERIALIHSEVSECLEGARKGLPSDHLDGISMMEEELADIFIRWADLLGALRCDTRMWHLIVKKIEYNLQREDHKPENRAKEGGKEF